MITLLIALLQAPAAPTAPPLPPASALSSQPAEPIPAELADLPNLTVTYYDVSGTERSTVHRRMQTLRPTDERTGQRHDAIARWTYQWRWRSVNGVCDLDAVEVTLQLGITLPRAVDYERMSRDERARWDRYINQLMGHERNHAASAVRGLTALRQAIRGAGSCEGIDSAAQQVVDRVAEINRTYDLRTRHGATEGIVY